MPRAFDQARWEFKMSLRQAERIERGRAAAADRSRLFKLHGLGATSIDEQRQLFPTRYPQRLD